MIQEFLDANLIQIPGWIPKSVRYLIRTGSQSYGLVNTKDTDLLAVVVPPVEELFPSLKGLLPGFDTEKRFSSYQKHHIQYENKWYDLAIYNIVDYIRLLSDNNPNLIDSLFVEDEDIFTIHPCFQEIRNRRKEVLSKKAINKFDGFARGQWEHYKREGRIKFAYHALRLLSELEQIIWNCDLKLKKDADFYHKIRTNYYDENGLQLLYMALSECAFGGTGGMYTNLPEEPLHLREVLVNCLVSEHGKIIKGLLGCENLLSWS